MILVTVILIQLSWVFDPCINVCLRFTLIWIWFHIDLKIQQVWWYLVHLNAWGMRK